MAKQTVTSYITYAGLPVFNPRALVSGLARQGKSVAEFVGRANSYTCPLGSQPGRAFLLMLRQSVDSINKESPNDLVLFAKALGEVRIRQLYFVRALNMTPTGKANDPKGLCLVELADVRLILRRSPVNIQYNYLRATAPDEQSFYLRSLADGDSQTYSWLSMAADLWLRAGISSFPGLPVTPSTTPLNWSFVNVSALDALSQVLNEIGCELRYNPFTATFDIVQVGVTDSAAASLFNSAASARLDDRESVQSFVGHFPATVRVFFRAKSESQYIEDEHTTPSGLDNVAYTVDVPTGVSGALGTVGVWDDLVALFDNNDKLTNAATIQARATERKDDYLRQKISRADWFQRTYSMYWPFLPGSQLTEVRWRELGDGPKTDVYRMPRRMANRKPPDPWVTRGFWVKLTSNNGSQYAGVEVTFAGGSWNERLKGRKFSIGGTGDRALYEANSGSHNSTSADGIGAIVWVYRAESGNYVFDFSTTREPEAREHPFDFDSDWVRDAAPAGTQGVNVVVRAKQGTKLKDLRLRFDSHGGLKQAEDAK